MQKLLEADLNRTGNPSACVLSWIARVGKKQTFNASIIFREVPFTSLGKKLPIGDWNPSSPKQK